MAVKYKDGIMMSADTLGSYGTMARYRSTNRIRKVGENAIIGGSGDYSDFQSVMQTVDKLIEADWVIDDGSSLEPKAVQQYLSRVMYQRRSKFDPLWNELVLAGHSKGKSFLGYVDLRGGAYEANGVAFYPSNLQQCVQTPDASDLRSSSNGLWRICRDSAASQVSA
jgi:20S proteasome subunit beta 7